MNKPLIDILIVENNNDIREMLETFFMLKKITFKSFSCATDALKKIKAGEIGCIISNIKMPTMDGIEFTTAIRKIDKELSLILITEYSDIDLAVRAVKAGATEFIEKPIDNKFLYVLVMECLAVTEADRDRRLRDIVIIEKLKNLTVREIHILKLLAMGLSNKEVGLKLDISYRTVEIHRSHIMEKLQAKSVVDFVHAVDNL